MNPNKDKLMSGLVYDFFEFIRINILAEIVVYSIIFFLLKPFFSKKEGLLKLDEKVVQMVTDIGLFMLVCSLVFITMEHFFWKKKEVLFPVLIQFVLWFGWGNLLRINFFRKYLLTRLFVGLFLLFSIDFIAIPIAAWNSYSVWSVEPNAIPKTWLDTSNIEIDWSLAFLTIFLKLFIFLVVAIVYDFLKKRLYLLKNSSIGDRS